MCLAGLIAINMSGVIMHAKCREEWVSGSGEVGERRFDGEG